LLALEFLHLNYVVHGDIKAANVLLDKDGNAKLADFGNASILYLIGDSEMKYGTIRYTAPENMTSGKQTLKGEIWSFGCLVLEMATGKKPYSEHCFKS